MYAFYHENNTKFTAILMAIKQKSTKNFKTKKETYLQPSNNKQRMQETENRNRLRTHLFRQKKTKKVAEEGLQRNRQMILDSWVKHGNDPRHHFIQRNPPTTTRPAELSIIIIIIAFKGAIRDFLQSPHSTVSCLQHVRSSSPGATVWKSHATLRAHITCKCHVTCHLVRRDSSAIKFDRVEITFIWGLFYWLNY